MRKKLLLCIAETKVKKFFLPRFLGNIYQGNDLMLNIDTMPGIEFESWCAVFFQTVGFYDIQVTKKSGDQGVDILAKKDGESYAIQCKRYSGKVGNKAVQEVAAGKIFYNCQQAIVITNNYFTESAIDLARHIGVALWDRNKIIAELYAWRKTRKNPPAVIEAAKPPHITHSPDKYNPFYHNRNAIKAGPPPEFHIVEKYRSRKTAVFLGIFLGFLGIHNIYLRKNIVGALQFALGAGAGLLTHGIFTGLVEIWAIVNVVFLLTNRVNVDGQGNPLKP